MNLKISDIFLLLSKNLLLKYSHFSSVRSFPVIPAILKQIYLMYCRFSSMPTYTFSQYRKNNWLKMRNNRTKEHYNCTVYLYYLPSIPGFQKEIAHEIIHSNFPYSFKLLPFPKNSYSVHNIHCTVLYCRVLPIFFIIKDSFFSVPLLFFCIS